MADARITQTALELLVVGDDGAAPSPLEAPDVPSTTYASVDLPDPSSYYLGFKDGRVLSFGTATRALSDLAGQWSANDLSCTLADTDRAVRQVLERAKGLRETPVVVRMIADSDRRALATPAVVFRGALRSWKPRGDLAVDLEFTDVVGLKLARRGSDRQLPARSVTVADFPLAPGASQAKPVPVIYGTHAWWTGAVPVLYVGTLDLGLGQRDTWVVAGHACKAITALYVDGVEDTNWGTGWFAPGQSGWPYATPYVDRNGRRYTLIQGQGPAASACAAGTSSLTLNVQGVESAGDGSGLLLEQSFLQYLHFFKHFVLQDYTGGAWPTDPLLWEAGWCQINEQSFVEAQAESARWVTSPGYVGQAYIGPERRSVRDWLAAWNTSLSCRLGLNRFHQWVVAMLPGALESDALEALPSITDAEDIHRGTFDLEALDDEAITRATVSAYRVPALDGDYGGSETYVDSAAEADAGDELAADLPLEFLAPTPQVSGPLPTLLSASASDVATRWIAFRTGGLIYRVRFRAGLCAWESLDVGQLFRLTHFAGASADGWTDRICWCETVALDIDARAVAITALDVTHAYVGGRTLELLTQPAAPPAPGDPPPEAPPIGSTSGMAAPTGGASALIDATLGSADFGEPGTTCYYKIVAVFDTGEESKPLVVGPVTTDGDGGTTIRKRVHVTWNAYPIGAQQNAAGATVTPVGMRIYRCDAADFMGDVQQCDLTKYPVPEAPGNLTLDSEHPGGTTLYYTVSHYYYLVGEGPKAEVASTTSDGTVEVEVDWWDDPLMDQVGTPGVFEAAVYGRTDADGDAYLDSGVMGWYADDGSDSEKSGSPWAAVTPGADLPLSATSFYDQWPGKQDTADNPWVSL